MRTAHDGGAAATAALREAVRSGLPALVVLVVLDAVSVAIASLAHPVGIGAAQPPPPIPWSSPDFASQQILIHVASGFAVGFLLGGLTKGMIGAAFGPMIDADHLSAAFGTTYYVRDAHSLVVLACLILVVGLTGTWRWGVADFALFSGAEFAAHFAVAPPGFPLLSPVLVYTYVFPSWFPLIVTAALIAANWAVRSRRGRPRQEEELQGERPTVADRDAALLRSESEKGRLWPAAS